jgi:hypothetical protein
MPAGILFCTAHATYTLHFVCWSWLALAVDSQIHWTRICCLLQRQHVASEQRGHLIIKPCKYQLGQCALTTLITITDVKHLWSSILKNLNKCLFGSLYHTRARTSKMFFFQVTFAFSDGKETLIWKKNDSFVVQFFLYRVIS